ncbi:glycoside hydrolase family 19 protein [Acinetobacter sp. ESBL14]|uniref:glycoside hydrolase family 19 protein n=1 Tax=Acinetobacter sp. ESBL14 TaxID=3077329 RepID=UPI002FCB03FD
MSNLVTITAKLYDKSGTHFNQLNVQSRYQGSSKANTQQTDSKGFFVFQASPNRRVEILAKPPNQKDYIVFKTIDSSILSSKDNPVKVQLPKTIDEYKQVKQPTPAKGIVSTFFKVVDRNGKVMKNFPVQSRPKGKGNSPDKFTDDQGIVEVKSSPNRDIEVLVLTSNDQFVLKSSVNSASGSSQPILIKLDEPYANFLSRSMIKILDRDGKAYVVEKTNVEMLIVESGKKQLYSISNGKLALESMVGQKLEFTVYKPDGKPLKPQPYMATRIKNNPAELHLDVDVTKGTTAPNDPEINKTVTVDILITMEQMQKMWPGIASSKIQPIMDELNANLDAYQLNTRLRQSHFFAQVFGEIGAKFSLREDISNYTAKNLMALSSYYKAHPEEAKIDAKISPKELKVKAITNKWYMDKNRPKHLALGNIKDGDGYKFLGRGLKQTTGRYNYSVFTKIYPKIWSDDSEVDFTETPELLEQAKYASRSAIVFWLDKSLYTVADTGSTDTVVDKITKVINQYAPNKNERRLYFKKAVNIFI